MNISFLIQHSDNDALSLSLSTHCDGLRRSFSLPTRLLSNSHISPSQILSTCFSSPMPLTHSIAKYNTVFSSLPFSWPLSMLRCCWTVMLRCKNWRCVDDKDIEHKDEAEWRNGRLGKFFCRKLKIEEWNSIAILWERIIRLNKIEVAWWVDDRENDWRFSVLRWVSIFFFCWVLLDFLL